MTAFYNATVEMGIADKVTSFTASDFGRTLASNGDGTDHTRLGSTIWWSAALSTAKRFMAIHRQSM